MVKVLCHRDLSQQHVALCVLTSKIHRLSFNDCYSVLEFSCPCNIQYSQANTTHNPSIWNLLGLRPNISLEEGAGIWVHVYLLKSTLHINALPWQHQLNTDGSGSLEISFYVFQAVPKRE